MVVRYLLIAFLWQAHKEVIMANVFRPSTWFRATGRRHAGAEECRDAARAPDPVGTVLEHRHPELARRDAAQRSSALTERIEQLAYLKWCADRCPPGRDLDYWLQAEREVLQECSEGGSCEHSA